MKKIFSLPIIVFFVSILFWGCEKNGNPPALPPAESMAIDFSEFIGSSGIKSLPADIKGIQAVENTNWTVAATVAGVWNSLLLLNLAIPVAAFQKATEGTASYINNKTWQWKYSINVLAATYTARLTGQIRADSIKWEMYISKEGVGAFSEFMWFEGTTAPDGNSGQWILYQSQANQVPMLQIDWTKEATGTTIGSVKYTYIKSGDRFKDSYIQYGLTTSTNNAHFTVHFYEPNRAKFVDVLIEWSTTGHSGRIKSADYFQDSNWHCWDANGNDVTCPSK